MFITFDTNSFQILEEFEKKQYPIKPQIVCECNEFDEIICKDISNNLRFERGNYIFKKTAITYMKDITGEFPDIENKVHIICLEFPENEYFDDENKTWTENILKNIEKLKGNIVIITNNEEKIKEKNKHLTYTYKKWNMSSSYIANFLSIMIDCLFVEKVLLIPDDYVKIKNKTKNGKFEGLKNTMFIELEKFSLYNQKNKKLKLNCSVNK